jgi:hypothetical protein
MSRVGMGRQVRGIPMQLFTCVHSRARMTEQLADCLQMCIVGDEICHAQCIDVQCDEQYASFSKLVVFMAFLYLLMRLFSASRAREREKEKEAQV